MSALQEIQESVGRAAKTVGQSVVGLGRGGGWGSGVVIGDGKVLTNAHTVRREEVTVTFHDGRQTSGRVDAVDADGDLAVVSVDTGGLPALEWSQNGVGVGTPVFALANPGGRGLRVTFGLVSAVGRTFRGPRGRRISGSIEHTAPLPRGSSGGPLVDADGRLLGINAIRLDGGLILALAADGGLRERAEALARGEAPSRPTLGIAVAPPRAARRMRQAVGLPERDGVLVRHALEGSPAAEAGIERGDLIVALRGQAIAGLDDLHQALEGVRPGETLELTVVRGTEERSVAVRLDGKEAAAD